MNDAQRSRLLVAVPVLAFLAGAWRARWTAEDAYITYRFSRNWVAGHGPVFNPGLPAVEGYSDFLWMAVAAGFEAVGVPPWIGCNVVSVLAGVGVLLLVHDLATRALEVPSRVATLALVLLATFPPFVKWATSGLEPMPQTLLFLAASSGLALREGRRAAVLTGLAGLGLALIRAEGIYWSPVFLALAVALRRAEGRPWREVVAPYVVIVGVGAAAWFAWRWHTYGPHTSQTATAKLELGLTFLGRGLKYLALFVLLELPVALVPVGAWVGRRRVGAPRAAWVLALALAYPAWGLVVGGDYMPQYRFFVPSTPYMALCGALGLAALAARRGLGVTTGVTAALTVLGALSGEDVALFPQRVLVPLDISSGGSWKGEVRLRQGRFRPVRARKVLDEEAVALDAFTEPGESVVTAAIGYNGYFNDLILFDRCGLVSPEVMGAGKAIDAEERPGHDRCVDNDFFLDREPDVLHFDVFYDAPAPAERLQHFADNWFDSRPEQRARYYPAWVRLDDRPVPGGVLYGMGIRRAKGEITAEQGWRAWEADLARLRADRPAPGRAEPPARRAGEREPRR